MDVGLRSTILYLSAFLSSSVLGNRHFTSARRIQQAVEGKPLTIHCFAVEEALKDVKYDDIEKMEWRKDGYVIAYYSKTRTSTESWVSDPRYSFDRSQFSLIIEKSRMDDSGQYKCWPRFHVLPQSMRESQWHPDVIMLSVLGPPGRPGRPAVLSYASMNVLVSWTASVSHADAPVLHYVIRALTGQDNVSAMVKEAISLGNGTSWLVTGLQPLTVYRFEVAAENSVARGPFSATSYPIRTRGEPPSAPPRILSVYNSTNTSVIMRWGHPPTAALHGTPLAGYRIIAKTTGAPIEKRDVYLLKPDYTTFEILNLTPYTKYMITLEADNVFGFSPPATVLVLTAEGVPATGPRITNLRVLSSSAIALSFAPPNVTRGVLTHYTLYFQAVDASNKSNQPDTATSIKINASFFRSSGILHYGLENLESCKKYLLWITASTSRGESEASEKHNFVTDGVAPSQPTLIDISVVGVNSVFVEWLPPTRFCVQVDFYLVNLVDEYLNRRQFNTSETQTLLDDLEPFRRYVVTVRAATRSVLISERQRYYVGPESVSVRFVLIVIATAGGGGIVVTLRTSVCPFGDFGSVRQLAPLRYQPAVGDRSNVFYCDEALVPGGTMATTNATTPIGAYEAYPETQSSNPGKGGSGVSVVAVAVLGTFGLLILLVLLIMVLVHLWRRYFGGKDCLAYAADAIDANIRNVHSDVESGDDPDCESIQMEEFVEYVKAMHADSDSGFARLYERIEHQCATLDHFQKLSYEHSVLTDNKMKNRYVNILAYDHSRVKLRPLSGVRNSDFINANFIDGFRQRRAYIATQGPLPNTIADFWRMVWEQKVGVIVMITNVIERGRKKCEQYWPSDGEETYGSYAVDLLNEHTMAFFTIRTMSLRCVKKKSTEPSRIVVQYHCTRWADHGVPESASAILKFIDKSTAANRDPAAPIIVHCSAGVGRSGTYIVIDAMLRQMHATGRMNVCGFLKRIRHQRMTLVQTEEQYVFCYDALAEAITVGNTEVDARDFGRTLSDWRLESNSSSSVLRKQYEHILNAKPSGCLEAKKSYNVRKNREGAPLPTDIHRVVISAIPGETGSDYINAAFLPGYHRSDEFIVAQFPIDETAVSFWQMIWDNNCRVVVLLQEPDEDYKQFWPKSDAASDSLDCGPFLVSLLAKSSHDERSTCIELLFRSTQEEFQLLCQVVVCTDWQTTMQDSNEVWRFVHSIQSKHVSRDSGPLVVVDAIGGHEAASFCLLSAFNCQLDQEACVDVYTLARCYHERRPGVFVDFADYLYLHDCLDTLVRTFDSKNMNGGFGFPKSHLCVAAMRSWSSPSSLRVKSTSSLSLRGLSCNGYCQNIPKDTTL